MMTKGELRKILIRRLKQQKEDERRRRSELIRRKVFRLGAFRQAGVIGCYVALPYEVQTWRMIKAMLLKGKRVVVPIAQPRTKQLRLSELRDPDRELASGAYGVWEPIPSARRPVSVRELELILVPGLAFDRQGNRLGHGHGYFDRFLERLSKATLTIGLAFRFQIFDRLPTSSHDHPVHQILTD